MSYTPTQAAGSRSPSRGLFWLVTGLCSLVLAACGGGSADSPVLTPPPVACTPFTDSFGQPVTCEEMNRLAAESGQSFVDGGDAGSGAGDAGADGSGADGAPIANTELEFTDINGKKVRTRTDANGYYRISLRGMKSPLVATVLRDNKPWKSMLVEVIVRAPAYRKFYTINLTGLTDYVASEVATAGGLSSSSVLTPAVLKTNLNQVKLAKDALNSQIASTLLAANIEPSTFDPMTLPFRPDLTGYDKVLESVVVTKPTNGPTTIFPTYSVGGSITGTGSRAGLILANGNDTVSITDNTSATFTLPARLLSGSAYNVVVRQQPTGSVCSVTGGNGTVSSSDVKSVLVSCSIGTFTLGGTVSGLATGNTGLRLASNGQTLDIAAGTTTFVFGNSLQVGTGYNVTVAQQPQGATCTVNNAAGSVPAANVTNVSVVCNAGSASLGGVVQGLLGNGLVLQTNTQTVTVRPVQITCVTSPCAPPNVNLGFTFPTPLPGGTAYNVTVQTQPVGQTCTVSNGSGTMTGSTVTNVSVSCTNVASYTIGGVVWAPDYSGTESVVLQTGSQTVSVRPGRLGGTCIALVGVDCSARSGAFVFPNRLPTGSAYNVTVVSQPAGLSCTVSFGTGTMNRADVTNVSVNCVSNLVQVVFDYPLQVSSVTEVIGGQTVNGPINRASFMLPAGGTYKLAPVPVDTSQFCTRATGTVPTAAVSFIAGINTMCGPLYRSPIIDSMGLLASESISIRYDFDEAPNNWYQTWGDTLASTETVSVGRWTYWMAPGTRYSFRLSTGVSSRGRNCTLTGLSSGVISSADSTDTLTITCP